MTKTEEKADGCHCHDANFSHDLSHSKTILNGKTNGKSIVELSEKKRHNGETRESMKKERREAHE
jgi:hypothetical protein